jgi:Co/Zn/Cd efflux system component
MADCCCEGTIDTTALEAKQRRVLSIVLAINVATFLMMVAGSWISGSSSLLSGTLDNFGDALTYALSFAVVGASMSAKAKVAFVKGCLIMTAAVAVACHIVYRLFNPDALIVEAMGIAAILNLAANGVCLWLLTPHRGDDVNMSSVWECSRNDIYEGSSVIVTAALVWLLDSNWPDLVVAFVLLALFSRSAAVVLRSAWSELSPSAA